MAAKERMAIKQAYDKLTGEGKSYIYISDLRDVSGLSEGDFLIAVNSLVHEGFVELEIGFGEWCDNKSPYVYDDQEFYGLKWSKELPAFEQIWHYKAEIAAAWNEGTKKDAIRVGAELTGLKENTVSQNIQAIRFLSAEFSELETSVEELSSELSFVKAENQRIKHLEAAHKGILAENKALTKSLDAERQRTAELEAEIKSLKESRKPEPEQKKINLFDTKETEDMALRDEFDAMKEKIDHLEKLVVSISERKPEPEPEPEAKETPAKPAPMKMGEWTLNAILRGQKWYWRAFKANSGKKPDCVYIGTDNSERNVRERLEKKGFALN